MKVWSYFFNKCVDITKDYKGLLSQYGIDYHSFEKLKESIFDNGFCVLPERRKFIVYSTDEKEEQDVLKYMKEWESNHA